MNESRLEKPLYLEFVQHDSSINEDEFERFLHALGLERIEQLLGTYKFPINIKVNLYRTDDGAYAISMTLRIGKERIHFTLKDPDLEVLAHKVHKLLYEKIFRAIQKDRTRAAREQHEALTQELEAYCQILEQYAQEGRREDFFLLMGSLLDYLRGYVQRRIQDAYDRGKLINPEAIDIDQVMEDVLERLYRTIGKRPADMPLLKWVYRVIDEVLQDYIEEANLRETVFISLEELSAMELEDLAATEHLTIDAEGELYVKEDFYESVENPYYRLYSYVDFLEPEDEVLEQLDPQLLHRWIVNRLAQLSEQERQIFDLYVLEGWSEEEIADYMGLEVQEVKDTIERVRQYLREEFKKDLDQLRQKSQG